MNQTTKITGMERHIEMLEHTFDEFSSLKNEALKVFDSSYPLISLYGIFDIYWQKLLIWNFYHSDIPKKLVIQSFADIQHAFRLVSYGLIDRQKFAIMLAESRKGIENYCNFLMEYVAAEKSKN